MSDIAELARLDVIIEWELALAKLQGADFETEREEDAFRLGFDAALAYILRNAKEQTT